jgi:hypothetical protein
LKERFNFKATRKYFEFWDNSFSDSVLESNQRVFVEKPEEKRPLGRPRRRWEDNIKINLQEVEGVMGNGCSWLRIRTGGGHMWVR